ncbi:MAG: hypothetical protein GX905_00895 [Bacteroidales bacterium]|nr:hypothetical protein [Bacteroidales bacterium]
MHRIRVYQEKCFNEYKKDIGYPEETIFLQGTPIHPIVPIQTVKNKVFVVGDFPTAKIATIKGVPNVPIANSDGPLIDEVYYKGNQLYENLMAKDLQECLLDEIGVSYKDCWLTNLVKVYLFTSLDVKKYEKLGKTILPTRNAFASYAQKSMKWLDEEIEICDPELIITLGAAPAQYLIKTTQARSVSLLDGLLRSYDVNGKQYPLISLPHPRILSRKKSKSWMKLFDKRICSAAKNSLNVLRSTNGVEEQVPSEELG